MLLLVRAAYDAHELAVWASEDDCWALVLVREEFLIGQHLLAALVFVDASELYFAQEVPRHPVHAIKLTLIATVWAGIWILHEPVRLAIAAKWLFTILAFNWILEDVVTDSADKLRQECLYVLRIVDLFFFVDVLLINFCFVNDLIHRLFSRD